MSVPTQLRPALGLACVLSLGAIAAQTGTRPDRVPPGYELVYYDGLDDRGQLTGGRMIAPTVNDPDAVPVVHAPSTTLLTSGSSRSGLGTGDNRVDIVFVGDGYTASELGTFQNHVNNVVAGMFDVQPLRRYEDYFAIHRVDVVSNESGVDNDPTQGIQRDTAMNMGFWCGGTERALCVSVGLALSFASNAPNVDQVIALANSTKYGGVGYPSSNLATSSGGNGAAVEIVKHELGHSLGNLADEYTYGGPTNWQGGEPGAVNTSTYDAATMANLGAKWAAWLGSSFGAFDGPVGTFEGANYSQFGIYRPSNDSLMRSLNRRFNVVCAEKLIREIYREVQPIDDASDPAGVYGESDVLFVTPMAVQGAALSIQWSLDGVPIPGATGTTLDLSTLGLLGCTGEVSVTVRDETPWMRDEAFRDASMTQTLTYAINGAWASESCATTPNSVGPGAVFEVGGSPSVSEQNLTLGAYAGPPNAAILFFYADTPVSQPLGNGVLCASGTSQRLALASFDALGVTTYQVDWTTPPIAAGPTALLPGSTWIFQGWYRDAAPGGGATFDFTSAVRVRFCP